MGTRKLRRRWPAAAALVLALALALGVYTALRRVAPLLKGSGCDASAHGQLIPLAASQAGVAATIAGVAQRRALPRRAVAVAYDAALQESKLQNLPYGDRDSVGIFQQRPSEGWGPTRRLEDPVYATTKFFAALTAVPRYRVLPLYQAAQAVQRSADGSAYIQYAHAAKILATAFTGQAAHAVWCWYGGGITGRADLAAAARQLRRTFGPLAARPAGDPMLFLAAGPAPRGWAEAAWLVSHAGKFGIRQVRYQGWEWSAARGRKGWTSVRAGGRPKPRPGTVVLG